MSFKKKMFYLLIALFCFFPLKISLPSKKHREVRPYPSRPGSSNNTCTCDPDDTRSASGGVSHAKEATARRIGTDMYIYFRPDLHLDGKSRQFVQAYTYHGPQLQLSILFSRTFHFFLMTYKMTKTNPQKNCKNF